MLSGKAFGQSQDTTKQEVKKILFEDKRLLNGVRVGVDIAGIAYGFIANNENFKLENKYEINGDLGIKRWFMTLDLGTAKFTSIDADTIYNNSNYESSGSYYRVGADYRISKSAKSFLFFGGKFGQAFMNEDVQYQIFKIPFNDVIVSNPIKDSYQRPLSPKWIELTPGVKVYIWKNFYMGYTIRLKFLIPSKKYKDYPPMYIPGYGVGNRNSNIGFSFHLMYRIPFGKDPVIPLKGR